MVASVERNAKNQLVKHMSDDAIKFEEASEIDADLLAGVFAGEMSKTLKLCILANIHV